MCSTVPQESCLKWRSLQQPHYGCAHPKECDLNAALVTAMWAVGSNRSVVSQPSCTSVPWALLPLMPAGVKGAWEDGIPTQKRVTVSQG